MFHLYRSIDNQLIDLYIHTHIFIIFKSENDLMKGANGHASSISIPVANNTSIEINGTSSSSTTMTTSSLSSSSSSSPLSNTSPVKYTIPPPPPPSSNNENTLTN